MIKCGYCGKFISFDDIEEGLTSYVYTPDTPWNMEEGYHVCPACIQKEREKDNEV